VRWWTISDSAPSPRWCSKASGLLGLWFAIVDEAESEFIVEARMPAITSAANLGGG
jgi:hypothetical protein